MAALLLLGVEVALRTVVPMDAFPYSLGDQEYRAVSQQLIEEGPGDISVVGSSRAREAFVIPDLHHVLANGGQERLDVASFAVSAGMAAEVSVIVRQIAKSEQKPRLVVYGVTPDQLAGARRHFENSSLLWDLEEWSLHRDRFGEETVDEFFPRSLRNEVKKYYKTLRWRHGVAQTLRTLAGDEPLYVSPIRGGFTVWQKEEPSLVFEPNEKMLRSTQEYLNEMFRKGVDWVDTDQMREVENSARTLREAGVRLIFVELPLPAFLRDNYPGSVYQEFLSTMRQIAREHGALFVELEALAIHPDSLSYRDAEHVNYFSALEFTEAVASTAILPALRDRLPSSP